MKIFRFICTFKYDQKSLLSVGVGIVKPCSNVDRHFVSCGRVERSNTSAADTHGQFPGPTKYRLTDDQHSGAGARGVVLEEPIDLALIFRRFIQQQYLQPQPLTCQSGITVPTKALEECKPPPTPKFEPTVIRDANPNFRINLNLDVCRVCP